MSILGFLNFSFANVDGQIFVKNDDLSDYSNFVVWIHKGEKLAKVKAIPKKIVMHQKDKTFVPNFIIVRTKDTVDFKNKDDIFHNVFSLDPKNKFDLGVFKGGMKYTDDFKVDKNRKVAIDSFTFIKPGVTAVFCNIHETMMGTIRIVKHGYYAQVLKNGNFSLPSLPEGKHIIRIEGPRTKGPVNKEFMFPIKGKKLRLGIDIVDDKKHMKHNRKNGSSYPSRNESLDDDYY
ncbi:hypothetical protein OAB57_00490 [Bacteriovoracaceae bacterium]|nr:hypothetical protein [Bacteriovoracaceae bacterium]